jgi:hypothetical protein
MQAPIVIARTRCRQFAHSHPEKSLIGAAVLVTNRSPADLHQSASPPLADVIGSLQPAHCFPFARCSGTLQRWPQSFFEITSQGSHLLEHGLVQGKIGHQLFKLSVLVFELTQAAKLNHAHAAKPTLSAVEGLFSNAGLTNQLLDRHAGLGLAQHRGDLFLSKTTSFHRILRKLVYF